MVSQPQNMSEGVVSHTCCLRVHVPVPERGEPLLSHLLCRAASWDTFGMDVLPHRLRSGALRGLPYAPDDQHRQRCQQETGGCDANAPPSAGRIHSPVWWGEHHEGMIRLTGVCLKTAASTTENPENDSEKHQRTPCPCTVPFASSLE